MFLKMLIERKLWPESMVVKTDIFYPWPLIVNARTKIDIQLCYFILIPSLPLNWHVCRCMPSAEHQQVGMFVPAFKCPQLILYLMFYNKILNKCSLSHTTLFLKISGKLSMNCMGYEILHQTSSAVRRLQHFFQNRW